MDEWSVISANLWMKMDEKDEYWMTNLLCEKVGK